MSMSDIRKDAAEAGGQAEMLVMAAEAAATTFLYISDRDREIFVQGYIDGATLMATILRPTVTPAQVNAEPKP